MFAGTYRPQGSGGFENADARKTHRMEALENRKAARKKGKNEGGMNRPLVRVMKKSVHGLLVTKPDVAQNKRGLNMRYRLSKGLLSSEQKVDICGVPKMVFASIVSRGN